LLSPVTVQVCAPLGGVVVLETTQTGLASIEPPLHGFTVYTVASPSATNDTATAPLPAFFTVGVDSTLVTVICADGADTPDVVLLPLGVTVNVYTSPL
jgi:hypothetical protein